MKAAKARGSDVLIVDTRASAQQVQLMASWKKMKAVAGREVEGAPHETLLVVDAVTETPGAGASIFENCGRDRNRLTNTGRHGQGGIAVAIAKEPGLPIRLCGNWRES